nr:hypothetical protein [Georgenia sp. H159]
MAADLVVVQVRSGGRLVVEHPRRWACAMTITDPAHITTAAALRHDGCDSLKWPQLGA